MISIRLSFQFTLKTSQHVEFLKMKFITSTRPKSGTISTNPSNQQAKMPNRRVMGTTSISLIIGFICLNVWAAGVDDCTPNGVLTQHKQIIDEYLEKSVDEFESFYTPNIFGQRLSVGERFVVSSKDGDIQVFHRLGNGGHGTVYAGKLGSKYVAVKVPFDKSKTYPPEVLEWIRNSDRLMPDFLNSRGLKTARTLGEATYNGKPVLIKEFVPGHTYHQLSILQKNGKITKAEFEAAESKFQDTLIKLGEINESPELHVFAEKFNTKRGVDDIMVYDNFIYSNGEWILVDP